MRAIAKWCYTHRRLTLAAWIAALLALTAIHSSVGSSFNDNFELPGTDSFNALRLLERSAPKASGDTEQVVFAVKHGTVRDPAVRARVQRTLAAVAALPHVTTVASPYASNGAAQISPTARVAFANVTFDVQTSAIKSDAAKRFVHTARAGSGHGVEVEVNGQVAEAASQSGPGALPIGFLVAGLVLFVVFGSLLAMSLPLLCAALSLGTGVAVIGLASHVISMPTFSTELSLLIGLGVGVDYALFILTRYRQGLLRGLSGEQAVIEAVDTSGRAVVFAGMIVCIAMLGLAVLGLSLLTGAGVAASIAVAFTVAAALTLLPALLGFFGMRVLRRRERRALRRGELRTSDESVRASRARGGDGRRASRARRRPLHSEPRARRSGRGPGRGLPDGIAAGRLDRSAAPRRARGRGADAERGTGLRVVVGGQTAIFDDFSTVIAGKLPLFLGLVVALSFLLLMAVFRSLLIPLIAAAMNILSAAAAFGVVTAIFQDGVGASLIGIDKIGPIDAFVPVMMFAVLFGLSMDDEVFLVTPDLRGVASPPRQRRRDRPRARRDRPDDHRRRRDHGPGVRGVRARRPVADRAVRLGRPAEASEPGGRPATSCQVSSGASDEARSERDLSR